MTRYPIHLPDENLTDWYAGARLKPTHLQLVPSIDGWESTDSLVAFTDIGSSGGGLPSHGQLVVYAYDVEYGLTYACSAEIDPDDAIRIAETLTRWAKEAKKEAQG